ncbi:claudin-8-like [Sphaerodactylus townsendi]|uniref:claudin-8-like n=1 Tax=Sphaerodactylus townsendi TaxID=933632 RepID=UPI002025FF0F|nr:claudin-8-like [Sphaerodactylus townsendi]
MACRALEILALMLGIIGMFGTFAVTLMPQWKVTAFIENNILTSEIFWEGLWMNCIKRMNGPHVCVNHMSMLALKKSLGVSRALMCIACALSVIAVLFAVPGMKCFRCLGNVEQTKMLLAAGVIFVLTGIIVLIPVSWVANNIIKDFYDTKISAFQKHELGAALYLGWTTSAFLISGGGILCHCHCTNPRRDLSPPSPRLHKPDHVKGQPASARSYV